MPLRCCTFQLNAFAMLFRASPSHCDSVLFLCLSFPCPTKPLPCITLITLQCVAFAVQFRTLHIFATALHIDAVRCHCFACPRRTSPLLRHTLQGKSWPRPCYQLLRFSSAMLCVSSPCLRCSTQVTSLPRNTAARLRILHYAAAFLCSANHCVAIAMQRYTLAAHASV